MKSQVLSIEQMQTLIDKGVDVSGASMYYEADVVYGDGIGWDLNCGKAPYLTVGKVIPTFDLIDMINIFPKAIVKGKKIFYFQLTHYHTGYYNGNGLGLLAVSGGSALQNTYEVLLNVIDNGYLKQ